MTVSRTWRILLGIVGAALATAVACALWLRTAFPEWWSGERSNLAGIDGRISYPFNSYGCAKILARELPNIVSPATLRVWAAELAVQFPNGTPVGGLSADAKSLPVGLATFMRTFPAPNSPWRVRLDTNQSSGTILTILSFGSFGSHWILVTTPTNQPQVVDRFSKPPFTVEISPGFSVGRTP